MDAPSTKEATKTYEFCSDFTAPVMKPRAALCREEVVVVVVVHDGGGVGGWDEGWSGCVWGWGDGSRSAACSVQVRGLLVLESRIAEQLAVALLEGPQATRRPPSPARGRRGL
jgi:hypothetical protein